MQKLKSTLLFIIIIGLLNPILAQDLDGAIPSDVQQAIRKEGDKPSSIMRSLHFLTDVYGPRLTGSPNLKNAGDWAIKQMSEWGLVNGHLEPWDFGHPGWANERLVAHIVSPIKEPLSAEVLAWTPSTDGTVISDVIQMLLPPEPTEETLKTYLNEFKDKVKGKIVMVGKPAVRNVNFDPRQKRLDDAVAKERYSGKPVTPTPARTPPPPAKEQDDPSKPKKLSNRDVSEKITAFLKANGASLRIVDGGREHRQIAAFGNSTYDISKVVPTVLISNEDYGRIARILADGTPVTLEFNVVNKLYPEGKTAYNVIAEIPGTDKKDEVIIIGAHMDSWHAATGATDNAIGCAVMMEAMRILQNLGIKPRRTIRIALWSGEEQGLLGSIAYVKEHFGTADKPKPEYSKLSAYFNIDTGTGKARGMSVLGPPQAADLLRNALAPFSDLGFMGTIPTSNRAFGGSDHTSFNNVGLPGIGVAQDPIEYFGTTWHTNVDTYERIIEDDAKKSAIIIASAVYLLAMQNDMLPRLPASN